MAAVAFKTKHGMVSFQDKGKRKRARTGKANAYALYVKKHIGKFIREGKTAVQAMRLVAKQYKGR